MRRTCGSNLFTAVDVMVIPRHQEKPKSHKGKQIFPSTRVLVDPRPTSRLTEIGQRFEEKETLHVGSRWGEARKGSLYPPSEMQLRYGVDEMLALRASSPHATTTVTATTQGTDCNLFISTRPRFLLMGRKDWKGGLVSTDGGQSNCFRPCMCTADRAGAMLLSSRSQSRHLIRFVCLLCLSAYFEKLCRPRCGWLATVRPLTGPTTLNEVNPRILHPRVYVLDLPDARNVSRRAPLYSP
ncbi:hypothetical protein F5Y18DRAFT_357007 [Xylariaceae sp. FL1019]|nr:hypothetical protein F5Y18DRAFT_357007 [Xylariaceae sp. FL1019]